MGRRVVPKWLIMLVLITVLLLLTATVYQRILFGLKWLGAHSRIVLLCYMAMTTAACCTSAIRRRQLPFASDDFPTPLSPLGRLPAYIASALTNGAFLHASVTLLYWLYTGRVPASVLTWLDVPTMTVTLVFVISFVAWTTYKLIVLAVSVETEVMQPAGQPASTG
jgi:hypothetical protein